MGILILTGVYGSLAHKQDIRNSQFASSLYNVGGTDVQIAAIRHEQNIGHCNRIRNYFDVLRNLDHTYDTVILSDFRDVVWQEHPAKIEHSGLDFYCESLTFAHNEWNSDWYCQYFGNNEFLKVQNKAISCSGFVVGTQARVREYLRLFVEEIDRLNNPPYNQAIHNYVIYNRNLKYKLVPNGYPVYTVGLEEHITVKQHKIFNNWGDLPIVVHQFDRHIQVL